GAISGTGGSLAKTGTGTLTLSGNNSYTGNTTISGGILSIAGTGSLPGWDTVSRYSVANNTVLAVYNAVTDGNITTMLGTGNFAAGASLGFDTTTADRSYTPVIANTGAGALGVTKIGANTLTLSGNNSYTGSTTVNAGKLLLNGDQSSANGAVTVASGATLGGSGTIGGDITINDGGTLNPGASGTPAKLTAKGNVSFSGSAPVFTITTSGATYDQVDCASTLGK
ncbi:MAG: autotransporter-associated beta strand repeat-containing protein, partial [Kiritimatiellaeota bacterium]|nr:autotransporter-associated beta strand repeat-containing protein [Kiritimatiellota bacterium]